MRRGVVSAVLLALVVLAASCATRRLPVRTLEIATESGAIVSVEAEIADTEETRRRGFMERESIPDGTGMLFVYEKDEIMRFWMKNTPTPLSIAYIDSSGRIRDIFDMQPFSLKDVASTVSVRYALEVPQGWFARAGVSVGDTVIHGLRREAKEISEAFPETTEGADGTKIRIRTRRSGRSVFLNGNARGRTPLTITSLVPGFYTLSLDGPRSEGATWAIEVKDGRFDSYFFE